MCLECSSQVMNAWNHGKRGRACFGDTHQELRAQHLKVFSRHNLRVSDTFRSLSYSLGQFVGFAETSCVLYDVASRKSHKPLSQAKFGIRVYPVSRWWISFKQIFWKHRSHVIDELFVTGLKAFAHRVQLSRWEHRVPLGFTQFWYAWFWRIPLVVCLLQCEFCGSKILEFSSEHFYTDYCLTLPLRQ